MKASPCSIRHQTRGLLLAIVLLAALLVGLWPQGAAAQVGGVALSARPLYDGVVKYGEWLPIRVHLENSGNDVTGRVQVRVGSAGQRATVYALPVELPRGARKEVALYVLPNTFSRRLAVEFVTANRSPEALARAEVAVDPTPHVRLIIGIVSGGGEGLEALAGLRIAGYPRDSVVVPLALEELPDRAEGLQTLDALVVSSVDTSRLSPRQRGALEQWVRLGGTLIVGGGPTAARTLAGLPEQLRPVELVGETTLDELPVLAELGGEAIRVAGPFPAAVGAPLEDASLRAGREEIPLLVTRPVGQGSVLWIALDPALSPFDAWAGADTFWTTLLEEMVDYPADLPPDVSPRQISADQIGYALSNLPSLDLPSLRLLAPLLLVYILVVGPLNYLVLRWQRRLELAWVTIPAITLLFSLGAYLIGFQLRGGDVIINQISTILLTPDVEGGSLQRSYVGVFSPARRSYTVALPDDVLVSPLNSPVDFAIQGGPESGGELVILQGNPTMIQGLSVNQWSMQSFMAEAVALASPSVEATLRVERGDIVGTVENISRETLQDIAIVHGAEIERLGDLAPGEQIDVRLNTGDVSHGPRGAPLGWLIFEDRLNRPGPSGPPRELQIKQQILDSVFSRPFGANEPVVPGAGPLLVAWAERPAVPVNLPDQRVNHVSTTLVYGRLPVAFDGQEISVPVGMALFQIDGLGVNNYCQDPRGPGVPAEAGGATVRFRLPPGARDISVGELGLYIVSDTGMFVAPPIEAWDWQREAWIDLGDNLTMGRNVIPEPGRFVRDGAIQLRLAQRGARPGGCLYFDVSLTGVRS